VACIADRVLLGSLLLLLLLLQQQHTGVFDE
jgi:hypothetical protein